MALDGRSLLALAFLGRLFVELAAARFGNHTRLFAGALEAAQRILEGFVFLDLYIGHQDTSDP